MENKTTDELIETVENRMHYYRTCTILDSITNEEVTGWEIAGKGENPIIIRDVDLDTALTQFDILTQ